VNPTARSSVIRLIDAERGIPGPAGERSILALKRGTLDVSLSLPLPPNQQTPHTQDEIYVVIRGRGVLVHGGKRDPFESGDLLFVAAGTPHHYEDLTKDLALWRVFYGPPGGELPLEMTGDTLPSS
jgi:mannose-6-phosphate isomerase-like protein (cupin superfamily)